MKRKKAAKGKAKKYDDNNERSHSINEDTAPYITKNRAKDFEDKDDLTEEQGAELDKAFEEMENGEYVTMAEFKKGMSRWLIE